MVSLEWCVQVVPELLRSEPVQDVHSCDMWGFGRVVHELFGSFESPNFPQVRSLQISCIAQQCVSGAGSSGGADGITSGRRQTHSE